MVPARVLVAIASHGTKNDPYLERLLETYRSMTRFEVDIVVLSDRPKQLGADVEVHVGAPTRDPWSLPFAHRRLFGERRDRYDLFVYSEDDTLMREDNLAAFLEVDGSLPSDLIPGFLRYEEAPDGTRWFNDAAFGSHWDPTSPRIVAGHLLARFTNPHAACYVLTRAQLRTCIRSGRYLIPPHAGRFDMLVSAATDPYTRCGLEKVIPLARLDDFLLHHLPNKYVGRMGASADDVQAQLRHLERMAQEGRTSSQLFPTEKPVTTAWDKRYDEPALEGLTDRLPRGPSSVLTVGVGSGEAERQLFGEDAPITGIPLDEVVAASARRRNVRTTGSEWDAAIEGLLGERFDVLLLVNVLHHLRDPVGALRQLTPLLAADGRLVATVPNLHRAELRRWLRRPNAPPVPPGRSYDTELIHRTDLPTLLRWLRQAGLEVVHGEVHTSGHVRRFPSWLSAWLGTDAVATASRPRIDGPSVPPQVGS